MDVIRVHKFYQILSFLIFGKLELWLCIRSLSYSKHNDRKCVVVLESKECVTIENGSTYK